MSAALYRDAFILHQPILISVAENDPSSPVRTGSYKNSAMVISALLEPVLTGDFKSFATVISALLEPVLTGDFKSFATVISESLELSDRHGWRECECSRSIHLPDGRFAAQFTAYW